MTFKKNKLVTLLLAGMVLLAACAPAQQQAAQDPNEVLHQVETAVAATVAAQMSATAAAQPLATETLIPTATVEASPTPELPTATPFIIPTVTKSSSGGGGGGGTTTQAQYACDVIRARPYDNEIFKPGDSFDIKWTILNTGTATWPAGYDLKYYSGPKMTGANIVELPQMKPGDQFSVRFDAAAPNDAGFQVMTWIVQGGMCYPYVAINVTGPNQ